MTWIQKLKNKRLIGEVIVGQTVIVDAEKKKKNVGKISIRGFIGNGMFFRGVTDKSVEVALNEVGKVDDLIVVINSGGGSVFDAFSIFTQLRKFPARIVTEIEGVASSAAAFLSQSGDRRLMSENAMFMIHEASGGAQGKKGMIRKLFDLLSKIDGILEKTFVKTSKSNLQEVRGFMESEEFMTAEEALARGFVDRVTDASEEEPHVKPEQTQEEEQDTMAALDDLSKKLVGDLENEPDKTLESLGKIVAGIVDEKQANNSPPQNEEAEIMPETLKKILNALNVKDENELLGAIEKLKKDRDAAVTAAAKAPQATLESTSDGSLDVRLVAIETKQTALEKENKSLRTERDIAIENSLSVVDFKNKKLLEDRKAKIDNLFTIGKINPVQNTAALEAFVDIDAEKVDDTEANYQASLSVWEMNEATKKLENLNGRSQHDPDGLDDTDKDKAEKLADKIEDAVQAYMKKESCSHDQATKALEISSPEMFEAYDEAMSQ